MKLVFATAACLLCLASPLGMATEAGDVKKQIQERFQGRTVNNVQQTPIKGVYQVNIEGRIFYSDGDYLIKGEIYDLNTMHNLTNQGMLEAVADEDTIVFPADGETRNTLTVFTDTTCGYCRKFHQQIGTLNAAGITVRYMLYPRMGLESSAAQTLESVWCADDPGQALSRAKAGKSIADRQCKNPLEEHVKLAHQFGLRGTPLIITNHGEKINGYVPAEKLIQRLN